MRDIVAKLQDAGNRLLRASREIHANEMHTTAMRHVQASELAKRVLHPALKASDVFYKKLTTKLEQMEAEIAAPKRPSDLPATSDIQHARHALFRMRNKVRNDTIAHALKTGTISRHAR
jgi:aconitase A